MFSDKAKPTHFMAWGMLIDISCTHNSNYKDIGLGWDTMWCVWEERSTVCAEHAASILM